MPQSSRTILMVALLIAPVICCLVGAGAVVHLGYCLDEAAAEEDAANRASAEARRNELQQDLDNLQSVKKGIEDGLATQRQREATLERKLQEKKQLARDGLTEQTNLIAEIDPLKKAAKTLDDQLAQLRLRITQAAKDPAFSGSSGTGSRHPPTGSGVPAAPADGPWNGPLKMHPLLQFDRSEPLRQVATHLITERQEMLATLENEKAKHQKLLEKRAAFQQEQTEREKTYSVTTLTGGQSRRERSPVYVECTSGGVILQPVGTSLRTALTARDQAVFLAAARRTRYVVFLIRPDGFRSFRQYRQLVYSENRVTGTPIDIGFEPVGADWNLVY